MEGWEKDLRMVWVHDAKPGSGGEKGEKFTRREMCKTNVLLWGLPRGDRGKKFAGSVSSN